MKRAILTMPLGLGDNMYITISLQDMVKNFDEIIIPTPYPKWFQWDDRIKCVDPRRNLKLIHGMMDYGVIQKAHAAGEEPLGFCYAPVIEYVQCYDDMPDDSRVTVEDPPTHGTHPGHGYIDGLYYARDMVFPDVHAQLNGRGYHVKLSSMDDRSTDERAASWMKSNGLAPERSVLIDTVHQYNGIERTLYNSIRNYAIRKVADILQSNGFSLFEAKHPTMISDEPIIPGLPCFISTGYDGMAMVSSLIKLSRGVVLQKACRYLPLAQMHNKPMMVGRQGGFPLRAHNWPALTSPMFVELTPDDYHMCRLVQCDTCFNREISDHTIKHRTDSLIKMMVE